MDKPNILLLILDSARARNCSTYGYQRDTTPFLTKYADRATVYEQARAPGIHSMASHASMWTGEPVHKHQAVRHYDEVPIQDTIWSWLSEQGYNTGLFTGNAILAHTSNLSAPFETVIRNDHIDTNKKIYPEAFGPRDSSKSEGISGTLKHCFQDEKPIRSILNSMYHVYLKYQNNRTEESLDSAKFVDDFLEWQSEKKEPWAACVNLLDPHSPYTPAEKYDQWGGQDLTAIQSSISEIQSKAFIGTQPWWKLESFEHLYDGGIREGDAHVERLISGLKDAGVHDETLVIVTSDHGEGFGEISRLTGAKMVDHSWGIHEVLTHVPLIVKHPHQEEGHTVSEPVSLTAFPSVVKNVMDDSGERESHFSTDNPTIVTCYRLLEEDVTIFADTNERAEDYRGPWQAVYQSEGDLPRKYAKRGTKEAVVDIHSAQESVLVGKDTSGVVEDLFDEITLDSSSSHAAKEPNEDVNKRLSELGYIN